MTAVLVVGAGAVGGHAARTLAGTEGVRRVLVTDRDGDRAREVADAAGDRASAVSWAPGEPLPAGVGAVACALPAGRDVPVAEAAVEHGVPLASCADDPDGVRRLLDLDAAAREAGVAVVAGAGIAPGLSEVLACFAAGSLDEVTEVHIARQGVTGGACRSSMWRSARAKADELEGGAWIQRRPGSGRRLVYFPDPIGPRECRRAASAAPLLLERALPGLDRATARLALPRLAAFTGARGSGRSPASVQGLGAVHVEVRGHQNRARPALVFGAVDRADAATGAVLATAVAAAAGLVEGLAPASGAGGLAELAPAPALLAALQRRGVRAARFEGTNPG